MLRTLDLFSGIGGFSLGLERTGGFRTVAFCEIGDFQRKVLGKHWPEAPIYEGIRELSASRLAADGVTVDVICGGFPCQDVSNAGKRIGIDGERSGLWKEYARLVGELRPRYVIVENVAALLGRGFSRVLGGLAALGYDAEWHCIPAAAIGADHLRDRLWIIAYPGGPNSNDPEYRGAECAQKVGKDASHNLCKGLQGRGETGADCQCPQPPRFTFSFTDALSREYRALVPVLGRGFHGIPNRVDRISALGNAVVPQIPELIGHAIIAYEVGAQNHA